MIEVPRAAGGFSAVATRDAVALSRSGEAFFQYRELPEDEPSKEGRLFEILFGDGTWFLARSVDLEFFDG